MDELFESVENLIDLVLILLLNVVNAGSSHLKRGKFLSLNEKSKLKVVIKCMYIYVIYEKSDRKSVV